MYIPRSIGTRSPSRFDLAATLVVSAAGLLLMYANHVNEEIGASVLAMPAFLLVTVPLLWRGTAPLPALAATGGATLVHIAIFGTIVRCGVVFPTVALLLFAAAARLDRQDAAWALAAGGAILGVTALTDDFGPQVLTVLWPLAAVSWGLGRVARSRSRMVGELQTQTEELRIARDERTRLEVAADRARLSSELDRLLQRRLGELARMAEAGAEGGHDPAAATTALAAIEETSRQTLQDMRSIVGVLRETDAPTDPQPTLTALEGLVLRAKGGGARLLVDGSPRALPAGVELSAYRIVEHLLAALDDAPGVEVGVGFGEDALEIRVAGPAARRGQVVAAVQRARERVQLHRGTIESRTLGGRAEAVAHLPVGAEA